MPPAVLTSGPSGPRGASPIEAQAHDPGPLSHTAEQVITGTDPHKLPVTFEARDSGRSCGRGPGRHARRSYEGRRSPSAHREGLRGILASWLTTPHGTGPSTTR